MKERERDKKADGSPRDGSIHIEAVSGKHKSALEKDQEQVCWLEAGWSGCEEE